MNRNKMIVLFSSNLATAVLHRVLEKAAGNSDLIGKYQKEFKTSWEIAKDYRAKINPIDRTLSQEDREEIRTKTIGRVKSELKIRIEKGYKNIDLSLVEKEVDKALNEMIV